MTPRGAYFHLKWSRLAVQRLAPRLGRRLSSGTISLEPIKEPERPADWVELTPLMSGICGSDLSLLAGQSSPYLKPLTSFPAVLGHEVVAIRNDTGQKVVVEPTLGCAARRLPLCPRCRAGRPDDCLRRTDLALGPGLLIGYHAKLPGGWSERMWAPREQCIPIPDDMDTRRAVLTEPGAIVLSALQQANWESVDRVLIIGAGTLGLLATTWIGEIHPQVQSYVLARHPLQADLADRLGASQVVSDWRHDEKFLGVVGEPQPTMAGYRPYFAGGFDLVVVTAGSASAIADACQWARAQGQVVLVGGLGAARVDWTPIWSRNLIIRGAYGYGARGRETFEEVIRRLMEVKRPVQSLVTHEFPLVEVHRAITQAFLHRESVKTVLTNERRSQPSATSLSL